MGTDLQLTSVTKRFGAFTAVDDLDGSLAAAPPEVVCEVPPAVAGGS